MSCRSVNPLQRYGRPPSWICFTPAWDRSRIAVGGPYDFIVVQNLVEIGNVVSKIILCEF